MIFHELTIENVGPYADPQTLAFAHDERRPVTLLGGVNGAGKTTLMRALFHVLYGARSHAQVGQRGVPYKTYLAESIHHGRKRASIELTLTIPGLRDGERLRVRRQWRRSGRGVSEDLDVFVGAGDGSYDEALSESWDETIEQIAPLGVARLFFFDGEKIEALADLKEASESLRTAIGSLLGLDLVDQLRTDLVAVQRRALREGGAAASKELDQRVAKLEAAKALAEEARARFDELEQVVETARDEDGRAREALRAVGGDLVAQRDDLEADAKRARDVEGELWGELRELAAGPLGPLTLVPGLLKRLLGSALAKRDHEEHDRLQAVLAERDDWVVANMGTFPADVAAALAEMLERDRRERAGRAAENAPFAALSSPATLADLLDERLVSWRAAALQTMDRLDAATGASDDLDRRISRIPSTEAVRIMLATVAESGERVEVAEAALEEQRKLLDAADGQLERARARRDAELARIAEAEDGVERGQRVIQHAERAKETLAALRTTVAARHVERIADYALGCLELLLRKERLIEKIEIDPETFELTLRGAHGGELRPESLSAGERQLTALSLLWALARAAGRPLPVVIDTPLGRLDADHRRHVVERYLPAASHQVLVLSTDTEIDGELHERLAPSISSERHLVTDADGRTEILDGYLEASAA